MFLLLNKTFSILLKGLLSKSSKTTAEWLEWIAQMVKAHQQEVISDKDVQAIAKTVDNPDNGIRQSALTAWEEIYKVCNEQFWTLVADKLTPKAEDIIKARLKASLGIPLNSTPVEEKQGNASKLDKSPMTGRNNNLKGSKFNRSLNADPFNKSIPLADHSSKSN